MPQGKLWEQEVRRGLRCLEEAHPDFWWMRLQDFKDYVVVNPKIVQPHQPGDFIALFRGRFFLLECKSTHQPRFAFDWVRPHQVEGALSVERAGGKAFLLFSYRAKRPATNFALSFGNFLREKEAYLKANPKARSIPVHFLFSASSSALPLERRAGVLDLSPVFTGNASGSHAYRLRYDREEEKWKES